MPKTSSYPQMSDLTGDEKMLGVQTSATEHATLNQIKDFVALQAGAVTSAQLADNELITWMGL